MPRSIPKSKSKTNQASHAPSRSRRARKKVRYAVVGLGHIAQSAVLPGFANATRNSELVALVSDDELKLRKLSRHYGVPLEYSYDEYESCLTSGNVDAVYIALPNHLHRDYAVRAARAGIHVLCEKPLAMDEAECRDMIRACELNHVQLMTAYRLHFEKANLEAIRIIESGMIGDPRIFQSLFTMQVQEGNIRLKEALGGGTLYDIGIYCINAARYLFGSEPIAGFAYVGRSKDRRFREVDEMTSALLRFPEGRLAGFTASFGAADTAAYEVVGTRGVLRVEQAYEYSEAIEMEIRVNGRTRRRSYPRRDQFGPELLYFSDCILQNKTPEPSGLEGLRDVHIITSLLESIETGSPISLHGDQRRRRPSVRQEIFRAKRPKAPTVHVSPPTE